MSFAESLKDAVAAVFNWDRDMLEGSTKSSREWREQVDPWWSERLQMPNLTPRYILQHWGTNVLRQHFHDDLWIASVEYKLSRATDDIVISDVRFKNEIDAIHRSGGIVVRVTRGSNPTWYDAAESYNRGEWSNSTWATSKRKLDSMGIHPSEYSIVGAKFDYVLDNNGTIDDLHNQIKSQLLSHPSAT